MKVKIICFVIVIVTLTVCMVPAVGAQSEMHWYCVHAKNHERPHLDPQLSMIEKYNGYYLAKNEADKVIYLTFDAGYENGNVAKILDVLNEKKVTAAFFVLSHLVTQNTELVKRMFDEGHTVCNHTAHHKNMARVDQTTFETELNELENVCLKFTGREMARYYRPPEGAFVEDNLKWAKDMGYQTIFWSFAYADWDNQKQMSRENAKQKILSNLHPGEIMLLHPTSHTNAEILGEVIDQCRAQGYRFGTLDELIAGA